MADVMDEDDDLDAASVSTMIMISATTSLHLYAELPLHECCRKRKHRV